LNELVDLKRQVKRPKFRYGTNEAIENLAQELKLPYGDHMQDWSYEVADPADIDKYIDYYTLISDEDKKFVLMEIIIQATEYQDEEKDFLKHWGRVSELLKNDFAIHEYTIFYWSSFDVKNLEDAWTITPYMRELWNRYPYVG
jgi:hypothetical protein